jgi:hypothetical protein
MERKEGMKARRKGGTDVRNEDNKVGDVCVSI